MVVGRGMGPVLGAEWTGRCSRVGLRRRAGASPLRRPLDALGWRLRSGPERAVSVRFAFTNLPFSRLFQGAQPNRGTAGVEVLLDVVRLLGTASQRHEFGFVAGKFDGQPFG